MPGYWSWGVQIFGGPTILQHRQYIDSALTYQYNLYNYIHIYINTFNTFMCLFVYMFLHIFSVASVSGKN